LIKARKNATSKKIQKFLWDCPRLYGQGTEGLEGVPLSMPLAFWCPCLKRAPAGQFWTGHWKYRLPCFIYLNHVICCCVFPADFQYTCISLYNTVQTLHCDSFFAPFMTYSLLMHGLI